MKPANSFYFNLYLHTVGFSLPRYEALQIGFWCYAFGEIILLSVFTYASWALSVLILNPQNWMKWVL